MTRAATFAIETVRTEFPVAESGVTTFGAKEQVIPGGRFEHEKDTGASNDPLSELTVIFVLVDCPATTVAVVGEAPSEILVAGVPPVPPPLACVPQCGV